MTQKQKGLIKSTKVQVEAAKRGPVLFKTADGKPVYKGDTVYWLETDENDNFSGGVWVNENVVRKPLDSALPCGFSTCEAALAAYDAWLISQPVLSLSDIPKAMTFTDWEGLKQVVKGKIANR